MTNESAVRCVELKGSMSMRNRTKFVFWYISFGSWCSMLVRALIISLPHIHREFFIFRSNRSCERCWRPKSISILFSTSLKDQKTLTISQTCTTLRLDVNLWDHQNIRTIELDCIEIISWRSWPKNFSCRVVVSQYVSFLCRGTLPIPVEISGKFPGNFPDTPLHPLPTPTLLRNPDLLTPHPNHPNPELFKTNIRISSKVSFPPRPFTYY